MTDEKLPYMLHILRVVVRELATTVLPAIALALVINTFVAKAAMIEDGPSMEPTLFKGERLMTEKISYRFHLPARGDVVIAEHAAGEVSLIKRVVGLPGEMVEVRGGHTFINGQPIEEPWVAYFGGPDYPPTVIPAGHVFILGDNRPNSRDSRHIGPVPLEIVQMRARFVYWPPDKIQIVP